MSLFTNCPFSHLVILRIRRRHGPCPHPARGQARATRAVHDADHVEQPSETASPRHLHLHLFAPSARHHYAHLEKVPEGKA